MPLSPTHPSPATSTPVPLRRARWALTALPVVMAIALLATVWASYRTVRGALDTVIRGQGELLLEAVRQELDRDDAPPDAARLDAVVAAQQEAGLRCLALFSRGGAVTGGSCSVAGPELHRAFHETLVGSVVEHGGRRRLVGAWRPGPDRRHAHHGPFGHMLDRLSRGRRADPPDPPAEGHRPGRRPRPRALLLLEFDPVLTETLADDAARTLGIGGAAALALLAAAVLFQGISRRAERIEKAAERDRRLAELGEMSAVLAHEMRNPLAAMKGHAQLLAESLPAASAERHKAERVVGEALRLERLSADLLAFVRSQRIERAAVDPGRLLAEAAEEVGEERVELDLAAAPASWSLDAERMRQVLVNLLRNALQASPPEARVSAAAGVSGGRLTFTVHDRGPGVPAGEEERIFEPFHTTRVRGTGLGLAVARRIVALHGGEIVPETHPEGGAVFRVSLPAETA